MWAAPPAHAVHGVGPAPRPPRVFRISRDQGGGRRGRLSQLAALSADEPTRNTPLGQCASNKNNAYTNGSISRVFTFSWLSRAVSGQPRQRCHPASSQAINIKNSRCKKEESVAHRAQYNPLASCGLRARARWYPRHGRPASMSCGLPRGGTRTWTRTEARIGRPPRAPRATMPGAGAPRVSRRRL